MSRNASRTRRRKSVAVSHTSGMTANATSASRQSMASIIAMIASEREHVAEDGHHAGGEQLVQRLDVGGDPGHQPADRVAGRSSGMLSRCRCSKICIRRSYITRWPT